MGLVRPSIPHSLKDAVGQVETWVGLIIGLLASQFWEKSQSVSIVYMQNSPQAIKLLYFNFALGWWTIRKDMDSIKNLLFKRNITQLHNEYPLLLYFIILYGLVYIYIYIIFRSKKPVLLHYIINLGMFICLAWPYVSI